MKKNVSLILLAIHLLAIGGFFYRSIVVKKTSIPDVVVIDESLENYEELVRSSSHRATVILVENSDAGFLALQNKISKLRGVERLHILTHGTSGNFVLGRQQLNEQNIGQFSGFWKAVSNSFASAKSELLIYSCQLAQDDNGKGFVDKLHNLLGVSVAGSEDHTGASEKGGNWNLEYVAGSLIKDHVLQYLNFEGLLIPYYSQLSGSSSPFSTMKIFDDDQLIYGDFDGDGDIDIHLNAGGDENEYWQNNGSGAFSKVSGTANPFNNLPNKSAFYSAARYAFVADWDNDGDVDIFVTKRDSENKNVFYKNNNGVFQELTGTASPFYPIPIDGDTQLICGDFDADGDIDIHSYATGSADNDFWQNNGSGHFTKVTGPANPFRNLGNAAAFFANAIFAFVADWDNDGDDDIFVTKRSVGDVTGENIFYRNDHGTYVELTGNASPFKNIVIDQNRQFIYGDFDGDGDIDIHASSSNTATTLQFWRNNGNGSFTSVTGQNNPFNNIPNNGAFYNNSLKAFVADWDNDGDTDIFVTNRTGVKQNILFVQNGAPPVLSSSSPSNSATNVSVSANIVLNFSNAVSGATGKNIVIKRVSDNSTIATIPATSASVSGHSTSSITINPVSDFPGTTGLYVLIDKGAFVDADGRIFEGIMSSTALRFTTGATPTAPQIATSPVSTFNTTSATLGGTVTSDGGAAVTEYGIVWSTSPTPTLVSNKTVIGSGTGSFSQSIGSLPAGTQLFARAYAINSIGVSYGNEVSFYTKTAISSITLAGSSPTNSGSVSYNVTFAQDVNGVDATDFMLTFSGGITPSIQAVTGSGKSYTVVVTTGLGNGTIRLDFTGTSGTLPSASAFNTGETYVIYQVSMPGDYYKANMLFSDWNNPMSWSSSPDSSFWIPTISIPNASTASVSILSGQTITIPNGFSAATGDLTNSGTVIINASSLSVSGSLLNSGTLAGSGNVIVSNFTNTGTIAPGNSPGILSFDGNLANLGTMNMEISGTTPGTGYDQIQLTGTMTFSGTLNVSLIDGYTPSLGQSFTLVDAASSTGAFSSVNLPDIAPKVWQTSYDHDAGTFIIRVINDPMPVSLLSFNARKVESAVALDWVTTQETNSSHFEIQRSTDGLDWRSIGSVGAALESSSNKKYRYLDQYPGSGENLYRLKMIDLDGSFAYSKITSVYIEQPSIKISSFPNPVTERLFLDVKDNKTVRRIAIYNLSGTMVSSFNFYPADGIQVQKLPAGLYLLKVTTANGLEEKLKFLKN